MDAPDIIHRVQEEGKPLCLREEDRDRLKVLFLAKHAKAGGQFDKKDGSHAVYHNEIRQCLEQLGISLMLADSYETLFKHPGQNFIFTLFNRGQFRNSEIFASCLSEYHSLPYLGTAPSMRGFADDKHLSKILYQNLGIPTPRWQIYRTSDLSVPAPAFKAERYVIKPNNSSASWGIFHDTDWEALRPVVRELLLDNHDVIVEEYIPGTDVTVPVVGAGYPWVLFPMENSAGDPLNMVTYAHKRGFREGSSIRPFAEHRNYPELIGFTRQINNMIWPYDYGRFDYRITPDGKVFALEYNISCNLGSNRAIVQSANLLGYQQKDIVESVLANSLERQRAMFERAVEQKSLRWEM